MTVEQERAIALAQARRKRKEKEAASQERQYTVPEMLGGAALNFFPSLYRNILEPIIERPGETARGAMGLLTEAVLAPGPSPQTAQTIREDYAQAYGSPERLMRTIAEDPARPLLDISAISALGAGGLRAGARMTPPSLTRTRGLLETTGTGLERVSQAIDPFALGVRGIEIAGSKMVAPTLGVTTGTGTRAVQEAFQAGRTGEEAAQAFRSQMRTPDPEAVIGPAKQALENIRADRNQQYKAGMVDVKNDKTVLDFGRVDQTLADIRDRGFFKGKQIDRSAADTWRQIDELVQEWKTANPAEFHTPEGLDALKKAIGDIRDSLPFGTPARNVANNVYGAVRQQITDQAPGYAKVMKDYEEASALISEIEGTLSLGKKASIDQSLRKLQSILRNNVYTGYGARVSLGEELARRGAPNLFPQLSGMAMEPIAPRGLVGQGTAAAVTTTALTGGGVPSLLPLTLTSPRAVGTTAFGVGRVAGAPAAFQRQMQRYGARLAQKRPEYAMLIDRAQREMQMGRLDPFIMRQLTAQFGRLEDEERQ